MKVCKNCSATAEDSQKFCANCGSSDFTDSIINFPNDNKQEKKKKIKKIVFSIIGAWVAINIFFFAIAMLVPDDETANSTSGEWVEVETDNKALSSDGYYYAYDMKPDAFINKINSIYKKYLSQQGADSSALSDMKFVYDSSLEQNGWTTYTYTLGKGGGIGFYIDVTNFGIWQIRPVIDYKSLIQAGTYSAESIMSMFSVQILAGLTAYDCIDIDDWDILYPNLLDKLTNSYSGFYKNGILMSVHMDENLLQCYLSKASNEEYTEAKELSAANGFKFADL